MLSPPNFIGSAVLVQGFVDPTYGRYNVSLDGDVKMFNGFAQSRAETVLYAAAGLDPQASHELILTNVDNGKPFVFDSVNVVG